MSNPHCPVHVSVEMKKEEEKVPFQSYDEHNNGERRTRIVFRCRIPGCPRRVVGTTPFYKGARFSEMSNL